MNKPLRIGIDGGFLSGQVRGHARYTLELCEALDRQLPEAEFIVYCPVHMELPVQSPRWQLRQAGGWLGASPIAWLKLLVGRMAKADGVDVFWGPYHFLPALPASIPSLLTVHDFAYTETPGTLPALHALAFHLFLKSDVRRAGAIICSSQATADKLKAFSGRDGSDITPAIAPAFRPQTEEQVAGCRAHFQLQAPYLLNVATWEPRKNVDLLARTFATMKDEGKLTDQELVLVGKKGWRYEALETLVNAREDIRWLDYVTADALPALYAGAELFVFPSLYEGFGMPVLEARACGTRAVTTDAPELREAGGADSIYVELNEQSLAAGIQEGLARRDEPLGQPPLPDWDQQAALLTDIIRRLVQP